MTVRVGAVIAAAALGLAIPAWTQNTPADPSIGAGRSPRVAVSSPGLAPRESLEPGQFVRVIEDLNLGDRWMLYRDFDHLGGPGHLLLISAWRPGASPAGRGGNTPSAAADGNKGALRPAIHAGDRLVVEENSPLAEARLRAVALESATAGSAFNVRLEIGGRVIKAIALNSARATLLREVGR
jgi:hypothetical protein